MEFAEEFVERGGTERTVDAAAAAPLFAAHDEAAAGGEEAALRAGGVDAAPAEELDGAGLDVGLRKRAALPLDAAAVGEACRETRLDAAAFDLKSPPKRALAPVRWRR